MKNTVINLLNAHNNDLTYTVIKDRIYVTLFEEFAELERSEDFYENLADLALGVYYGWNIKTYTFADFTVTVQEMGDGWDD